MITTVSRMYLVLFRLFTCSANVGPALRLVTQRQALVHVVMAGTLHLHDSKTDDATKLLLHCS